MRAFRRGVLVAVIAVIAGVGLRFWGRSGTPATTGGWRELEGPDFR